MTEMIAGSTGRYAAVTRDEGSIIMFQPDEIEKRIDQQPEFGTIGTLAEGSIEKYRRFAPLGIPPRPNTDLGNAEAFIDDFENMLRYIPQYNKWFSWNGHKWKEDTRKELGFAAKLTIRNLQARALLIKDDDKRQAAMKWLLQSESAHKIDAMISLARSDPRIIVEPDQLDAEDMLLNTPGGIVNLISGDLLPSDPGQLCSKSTAVTPAPGPCPRWIEFLNDIFLGNQELIKYMQLWHGYGLTGLTTEHAFHVDYGTGMNGKTTRALIAAGIMGDYAGSIPVETFIIKKGSNQIPSDVASLKSLRWVETGETEEGSRLAESKIKLLSGGDIISARFLYGEFFTFKMKAKISMSTNHKPKVRGTDHAIWRRIKLIPFLWTCPPEKQNKYLAEQIIAEEGPQVLQWMIEGCLLWQQDGLREPDIVRNATNEYRDKEDVLAQYLSERTETAPAASELLKTIYSDYRAWCEGNGERSVSNKRLKVAIEEHGFFVSHSRAGDKVDGITLIA